MNVLRLSLVLLLAGVGWAPLMAQGQSPDTTAEGPPAVVQRVTESFDQGDAERLLVPSADRVEVNLFGTRTYFSSAQAFYVLRDFFRSHQPKSFAIEDVMEAEASCFVRGTYEQTRVSRPLQIYVRFSKNDEEAWELHEVRIENDAE